MIVASVPAAVVGIPLNDKIEELFGGYQVVTAALIVYGILFIVLENRNAKRTPRVRSLEELSYKTAFAIGMFQVLSLIPGTSRSGSTILGAMLIGLSRGVAAEFSFFLAIPAMFGASAIKLLKFGFSYTSTEIMILLTGTIVAFVVSVLAIKFLMSYIRRHDFKAFGWYRIILGVVVLSYFLIFAK